MLYSFNFDFSAHAAIKPYTSFFAGDDATVVCKITSAKGRAGNRTSALEQSVSF
jgi:hypothetical protein